MSERNAEAYHMRRTKEPIVDAASLHGSMGIHGTSVKDCEAGDAQETILRHNFEVITEK